MEPQCVDITIIQARGLAGSNSKRTRDCFMRVSVNGKELFITSIQRHTLYPQWNYHEQCSISSEDVLCFELLDVRKKEKVIAHFNLNATDAILGGNRPKWYQFETESSKRRVYVEMRFIADGNVLLSPLTTLPTTIVYFPTQVGQNTILSPVEMKIADNGDLVLNTGSCLPENVVNVPEQQLFISYGDPLRSPSAWNQSPFGFCSPTGCRYQPQY